MISVAETETIPEHNYKYH